MNDDRSTPEPMAAPPPPTDAPQEAVYPPQGAIGGLPQGPALDPPETQRNLGMFAHLIPIIVAVLTSGALSFVAALVVYLVYKDRGDFERITATNALNIQLTLLVAIVISLPLMLVLVGFLTAFLAVIAAITLHIIGAVRASKGELWTPPLTYPFVK